MNITQKDLDILFDVVISIEKSVIAIEYYIHFVNLQDLDSSICVILESVGIIENITGSTHYGRHTF